jgi:hypothetical protein
MKTIIINSTNVVSGSNNSRFRYSFKGGGYRIKKGDQIAVASVSVPYSFFNLTAANNNITFGYSFNNFNYNITLKEGFYTLEDINFALQQVFIANGHYTIKADGSYNYYGQFIYNISYYAVEWDAFPITLPVGGSNPNAIVLSGNIPLLMIFNNNFSKIIGFTANTTFPPTTQITSYQRLSLFTPNLTPINTLIINCNIVNNEQSSTPNSILAFSPNTTFGSNILVNPSQYIFVDANDGNYSNFDIYFTDQDGVQIICQDPNICIQLALKNMTE